MVSGGDERAFDTELASLQALVLEVLPTLLPPGEEPFWPYAYEHSGELSASRSASTTAMILFTLALLTGAIQREDELAPDAMSARKIGATKAHIGSLEARLARGLRALPQALGADAVPADPGVAATADEQLQRALEALDGSRWHRTAIKRIGDAIAALEQADPAFVDSSLFGDNDPLTLDWMERLVAVAAVAGVDDAAVRDLAAPIEAEAQRVLGRLIQDGPEGFRLDGRSDVSGGQFVTNVWPVVRVVYLARACGLLGEAAGPDKVGSGAATAEPGALAELLEAYFAREAALQLGFAQVRDSSFDVAQLVFALDGLTLCDRRAMSAGLLERAVEVVIDAHAADPRLSPRRPFKVTRTGGVHIPISVEVYASLVRIIRRVDDGELRFQALTSLRPVFTRYLQYLEATSVDVAHDGVRYKGWASDHEYSSAGKVETWYTSQVVQYLLVYGALLANYTADVMRRSADLVVRPHAGAIPGFFDGSAALRGIKQRFIADRATGEAAWSMLLYGPPGTGKTTIEEQLARQRDLAFITVTPSHFVSGGRDKVEARASQLFEALEHQSGTIVLFDEIDRLLLDRSSDEYVSQDDMFQFMTPSMLAKINDLRRREQVVFAIATNYAWRIDSAILRPGRIDERYLILPPDRAARRQVLGELADALWVGKDDVRPSDEVLDRLAVGTVLASRTELKDLVTELHRAHAADLDLERAEQACSEMSPTIRVSAYRKEVERFPEQPLGKTGDYLVKELIGVLSLLQEVHDGANGADQIPKDIASWLEVHGSAEDLKVLKWS